MMEPADAGSNQPRAWLRVGGATLARHQLALALSAGCERIVCMARQMEPELIELQHLAERAGTKFHTISGTRALAGLVTAQDEVLVMGDGLVPAPADALDLLSHGPVVLALPAETAIPAGFERIDLNHASADLMLLPGRLVDRLNELPADADPVSSLLRIALQAGVAQRLVPGAVAGSGRWMLIRTEDEAHGAEQRWMDRHTSGEHRSPGQMLAALGVRRYGPALLHAGSGGRAVALGGFVLLVLAGGAAWFGWAAFALALLVPAWLARQSAGIIESIQNDALGAPVSFWAKGGIFGWLLDAVLVGILACAVMPLGGEPLWHRLFAPVMLVGLLRLVGRVEPGWRGWLGDRSLLALLLCACTLGGILPFAVPLLAVILLAGGLFAGSIGITRA